MADDTLQVQITADIAEFEGQIQKLSALIASLGANANKTMNAGKGATDDWTRSFANLNGAFSSSISGMILGTETWQKVVQRLSQMALTDFVSLAQKQLASWIANELGMTTATETGAAERTAAEQSANTTSLASVALKALQMIATDAAQTFAGVFAFLSSVLGPAAAGPAAAAQATVLEAGNLVVAAGGLWSVPSDMLAMVHKQESILPANIAQPMRDFFAGNGAAGGGGNSFAITIQAIDTQTGAQFLLNNAAVIAQGLARELRNGNASLRKAMK